MREPALPAHVTLNWLAHCSGMHFNTVRKRLEGMSREKDGKFDRIKALGRLYIGEHGEVTYSEAMKGLALARKEQVELANQCTRRERIPIDVVNEVNDQCHRAMAAIIKAHHGKLLDMPTINELFEQLRSIPERLAWPNIATVDLTEQKVAGNGSSP